MSLSPSPISGQYDPRPTLLVFGNPHTQLTRYGVQRVRYFLISLDVAAPVVHPYRPLVDVPHLQQQQQRGHEDAHDLHSLASESVEQGSKSVEQGVVPAV